MFRGILDALRRLPLLSTFFRVQPPTDSAGRTTGTPTSSNRASSFHLRWELPPSDPITAVSATLEILTTPQVPRLYFWALQASFSDGRRQFGGAHLGLQFHPRYPGSTAVNWGGYDASGQELAGSASSLPSTLGNPNTRDYRWIPNRRYRLTIGRSPDGGWRGSVRDLAEAEETIIRDLAVGGDRLVAPMVWSEVFADCDHPSVSVRWSELRATTEGGFVIEPHAVVTNYQKLDDGGCTNTNSGADSDGLVQTTNAPREVPQGTRLRA